MFVRIRVGIFWIVFWGVLFLEKWIIVPTIHQPMKASEILTLLDNDGCYLVATRGSHRQFKHPVKPGRVTVPGKPGDDLAPGTLNSILKQAQLKR